MKRRSTFIIVLLIAAGTLLPYGSVQAGGFQISDNSARSTALGGALVATTGDPAVLYMNPSGLSYLQGTYLSIGTTVMIPDTRFSLASDPGTTAKMQSQVLFPPNACLTHTFANGLGLGLSASIPFALKTEWSPDWVGGRVATRSEIRVVFVSPAISFRLSKALSVGAAMNIAFSRFQLTRRLGFDVQAAPDGSESVEGSGETAYGFQAGLLYHPNDVWSLGASYESRLRLHVESATATFAGLPATQLQSFPDGHVSTVLTMPDRISAGIGFRPFRALYLEGDVQYMFWSSFQSLELKFSDASGNLRPDLSSVTPLAWQNSLTARAGLELTFGDVAFRAGFSLDRTPVSDAYVLPSMPDADRRGYSAGIGYAVGEGLHMDFAFSFLEFKERPITNSLAEYKPGAALNGTYSASMSVVGINVSYSWNGL